MAYRCEAQSFLDAAARAKALAITFQQQAVEARDMSDRRFLEGMVNTYEGVCRTNLEMAKLVTNRRVRAA